MIDVVSQLHLTVDESADGLGLWEGAAEGESFFMYVALASQVDPESGRLLCAIEEDQDPVRVRINNLRFDHASHDVTVIATITIFEVSEFLNLGTYTLEFTSQGVSLGIPAEMLGSGAV